MRAETALACDRKIISTQAWDLMDEEHDATSHFPNHTPLFRMHVSVECLDESVTAFRLYRKRAANPGMAQDTLRFAANTKTPGSASHRRVYALIRRDR